MFQTRLRSWVGDLRGGLLVAAAMAGTACGGSEPVSPPPPPPEPPPPEAASVTLTPASALLVSLGETAGFTAAVIDQYGDPYEGGEVAWTSSNIAVFTVEAGLVTAVANGQGSVTASIEGVNGTATVEVEQAPVGLTVTGGEGQEAEPETELDERIEVRIDDAGGAPVEGVEVEFSTEEGNGSANPSQTTTDASGLASSSWTLGDQTDSQTLTVTAGSSLTAEIMASVKQVDPPSDDSAAYIVRFDATWSASTHPDNFPLSSGPHFSPMIGAVHNSEASFWAEEETASPGIESMAETGATGTLTAEINQQRPENALSVINGPGLSSPGIGVIQEVIVTKDYPLVTLVTMIAPSPDWFAGVAGFSLLDEEGEWLSEVSVELPPFDAGTDSGPNYTSPNDDTDPQEPITNLSGVAPFSANPVGKFTFIKN